MYIVCLQMDNLSTLSLANSTPALTELDSQPCNTSSIGSASNLQDVTSEGKTSRESIRRKDSGATRPRVKVMILDLSIPAVR